MKPKKLLCPALISRRTFMASTAALSVGCVARGTRSDAPSGTTTLPVRPPLVGQSWRYLQRDYFTGAIVDTQTDRVSAVGESIQIECQFEKLPNDPKTYPSWGESWWRKYMNTTRYSGGPIEIHKPWGMVVVESQWSELQSFKTPIPLWPMRMSPGWRATVGTDYMIPSSNETMPWQLNMHAERWESVTVPAGRFMALRCYNIIDFRFTNVSERTAAQRIEHFWFVPEIGRWVRRDSVGTFREDLGSEVKENCFRSELLDWT